jgi:Photosynthetic reaction centre cytochrome C subunit
MRLFASVAVLTIGGFVAVATTQGQAQGAGQPPAQGRGGQAPRNLQVLPKDWTGQQVQQFMRTYVTAGLGVMCADCHVQDRSSDEKPEKVVARKMLQMMMATNDTLKDVGAPAAAGAYKVTCYSCHRGTRKPLTAQPGGGGLHQ